MKIIIVESSSFFLIYLSYSQKKGYIFAVASLSTGRFIKLNKTTTMIKLITTVLVLLAFFVGQDHALDVANYTAYIEELMQDEQFVEEYAKWSFELFSQPDYLYGGKHKTFPCAVTKDSIVPTSVHKLRPTDVKCVGAMGDSLTAGLGAHAITPVGLFFENRGSTFFFLYNILTLCFIFRYLLVGRWRSYIHKNPFSTQCFTTI
jgi:hypothetical protein